MNKTTKNSLDELSLNTPAPPVSGFKYQAEMGAIPGCPFKTNGEFAESFRAVHEDLRHDNNFLPQGRLEPGKYDKSAAAHRCMQWALSMYESPEQLKAMIIRGKQIAPNFTRRVGEFCARLELTSKDGRRTAPTARGHFSFYEFASFDANNSVREHFPLFP